MNALVIARKDLVLMARDRAALLFSLLVPVVVIGIVATSLGAGDGSGLLLPIANEDEGPVAEVLIQALSEHVDVRVVSRAEAEHLVGTENKAAAALVIPERTSKRYLAGNPSTLTLVTDPAKGIEVGTLKAYFLVADRDAASLADPFAEELLVLEEENLTGSNLTTTEFEQNIPGFSVMFVLMSVLFSMAFGLDDEKASGSLTRLQVAPIHPASVVTGKLLARYVLGVAQIGMLFAFGHLVFGLSLGPSVWSLGVMCLAIVFAIAGFSLSVASLLRSREQIIPVGLTVVMIVCSLGGCWWPLFYSPLWLQNLAHVFVTAWSMDGIQDLILRERGFLEVLPTVGILVAYGAICAGLGAWVFERRRLRY